MPGNPVRVQFGAEIGELVDGMKKLNERVDESLGKVNQSLDRLNETAEKTRDKMKESLDHMGEQFSEFKEKVAGTVEKIKGAMEGLAGILGGGGMFHEFIESTKEWNEQVGSLSHNLGMTMKEASELNAALRIQGITSDEYEEALRHVTRALMEHEKALNKMGMTTRDANHDQLKGVELMQSALKWVMQYKAGTDQAEASRAVFGRGAHDLTKMLELNDEVMKRGAEDAHKYALVVGTEDYEATKKYEHEVNELKLAGTGLANAIGGPVMRGLTSMAIWFKDVASAAARATKAIGDYEIQATKIRDMSNVKIPIPPPGTRRVDPGAGIGDTTGQNEVLLAGGAKSFDPEAFKDAKKEGKGGKGDDIVQKYEEELNRIKDSQTDLNAWSTEKEYEFWNNKLAATKKGSDEWWQIWHMMAEEFREMTKEQTKAAEEAAKNVLSDAKRVADIQKINADAAFRAEEEKTQKLYSLGMISSTQRYNQLKEMYDREYQEELKAYNDQLAAAKAAGDKKIEEQNRILTEIARLNAQHMLKMQKDQDTYISEEKSRWEGYASTVAGTLSGLLTRHQTMYQAMMRMADQAITYIIHGALKRMADAWVATEAEKTAATATGSASRAAAEQSGYFATFISKIGQQMAAWLGFETGKTAATTTGASTREGAEAIARAAGQAAQTAQNIGTITADAAVAYAGAFAATASIPVVGPAMAPGVAAASMGQVLAMMPMASASEGFDVPHDIVSKLHGKEMVLPRKLADTIRNMADDDGGGMSRGSRGGGDMHMHLTASDAHSFEKQLMRSNSMLNRWLKGAIRDYNLPLRR